MVLHKHQVPGRPTKWKRVERGPYALAVSAGGVVWTFFSCLSFFFFPLSGKRSNTD